jgi:hypothetical protein
MERLIDPVLADLQAEYAAAIGVRRRWLTLMVGYIAFGKVSLWCALLGVGEAGRNWNNADRQGLRHTLWLSACAIVIVSVPLWLLELPTTRELLESMRDTEFPPTASVQRLMLYLVPAILPLSVPIGLAMGIALASGRALSRRLIATIVLVALVTSAVSVAVLGWLTPTTNQLYREAIVGEYVVKGDREFTFPELNRLVQQQMHGRPGMPSHRYDSFVFELHNRIGFSIAPLTFCAFALVLAIRRCAGQVAVVGAVSLAGVGYLMIRWLGNALSVSELVSPQLGAWMPQIVLILTTIAVGVPRTFIRRRA